MCINNKLSNNSFTLDRGIEIGTTSTLPFLKNLIKFNPPNAAAY